MKSLFFVLLVSTLTVVRTKWAAPIEITSYTDPTKINANMFTDISSGVTYAAYCNSSDGRPYYAYLDNSGLFLTGPELLSETLRCYYLEISGPHDGQHIYIAMSGTRSLGPEDCIKENNYATCDDIYVFESEDGGQSWLPPKNIGGVPGDPYSRQSLRLLTNWNTPYLWVVYNKYVEMDSNIAVSRYDTKKKVFDEEHTLVEKFGELNHFPLITVDESGKSTLMLFYTTSFTLSLQTMVSTDEGVTWKKGESIKKPCKGEKMTYKTFKSRGKYILAGCSKGDDVYYSFSEDLGATWTDPVKAPGNDIEEVQFCTPENSLGTEAGLITLYSERKEFKMGYSKVPIEGYKNAYVPSQLYYVGTKMFMNCYYVGNELKMRFMYQMRSPYEGRSIYRLYIIDNDDLIATPAKEVKEDTEHKEDL